jgi:hypothetical protein
MVSATPAMEGTSNEYVLITAGKPLDVGLLLDSNARYLHADVSASRVLYMCDKGGALPVLYEDVRYLLALRPDSLKGKLTTLNVRRGCPIG